MKRAKILYMEICIIGRKTVTYNNDLEFTEVEKIGNVRYVDAIGDEEVAKACQGADAVLVNKTWIGEEVLSRVPTLKYVGIFATGYNNVDLEALKRHGVTCTNVPNYSTNAVAQHTLGLILNAAGSLTQYFNSVAEGDWTRVDTFSYHKFHTQEVMDKTLGLIGFGNIGKRVAKLATAFGMKVIVYNRSKIQEGLEQVNLNEVFSRSDFLSLHCALTEDTENIVNERTLSLMKKTACLFNTARGGLVDEIALTHALNEGKIAGAWLDVVSKEPMEEDNPLRKAKNCFMTPHTAWSPIETRQALVDIAADNLRAFLAGTPKNVIV